MVERTGHELGAAIRQEEPDVDASWNDGLTAEEAVAVAFRNSAVLRARLTDLDVALATFDEARRPTNPRLSFLAPIDPRRLSLALLVPLESLWQLPSRTRAANRALASAAESALQEVLALRHAVLVSHAQLLLGEARVRHQSELVTAWQSSLAMITSRIDAGDAAPSEADPIRAELAVSETELRRRESERDGARVEFFVLLGVEPRAVDLRDAVSAPRTLPTEETLISVALDRRPELRASGLAIEAAASRLQWEKERIASLLGSLDGEAEGAPADTLAFTFGLEVELPIFSRNEGGIGRAEAELVRAVEQHRALLHRVRSDVHAAVARLLGARRSLDAQSSAHTAVEEAERSARSAFSHGAASYLVVIDALRRRAVADLNACEIDAEIQRARADLDRAVGIPLDLLLRDTAPPTTSTEEGA
ncbi:MAG: TolC family protein [Planctomycetes bacterium]|nr:TolC family protein [Planctomycetota bacterium]